MQTKVAQLFLVNALSCGLELCLSSGTIYIPPLLLEAGMEERYMTMVLAVGPGLGLVLVPMIGNASDQWSGRFGRRRPFIWVLSLGLLLCLWLVPRASRLAALVAERPRSLEVLLLVLGACLMEFCGQACFTPLEALLSDLFPSEEASRQAFSVYSLMISLGGCVGYLLPALNWNSVPLATYVGGQEAFVYAVLSLIFIVCLLTTAFVPEEQGGGGMGVASAGLPVRSVVCCPLLRPSLPRAKHLMLSGWFSVLPRLYRAYCRLPLVVWRLFIAEVCSWMALMTFLLFYTDFVGEGLYQGVPTAALGSVERLRFDEGIRMGSLGLFLQCSASVGFSLLMERMVQSLGMRTVYLSSVAVLAFATAVMSVSRCLPLVTLMAAATGYTFCTLQILPYTLTCLYHSDMQAFFAGSTSEISEDHENAEKALVLPPGGIEKHCSNGRPGGKPGTGSSAAGLAAAPTLGIYVSLPLDGSLAPPHGSPEPPRGMGLDMAILDSAYLLSQLLPTLVLGYVVQLTHSVATYMACASLFSLLAIYFSSRVIFDRADLERHGIGPAQTRNGFLDART